MTAPNQSATDPSEMPTPRTDAEKTRSWEERRKEHYTSEARAGHSNDGWKFAEQLERDLSTLRKAAEAARGFIQHRPACDIMALEDDDPHAGGKYKHRICTCGAEAALASLRSELEAKSEPLEAQ